MKHEITRRKAKISHFAKSKPRYVYQRLAAGFGKPPKHDERVQLFQRYINFSMAEAWALCEYLEENGLIRNLTPETAFPLAEFELTSRGRKILDLSPAIPG